MRPVYKRNEITSHKTRPLNPLQVAEGPFHTWAIDHKDLCRKTTGGSVAILCCVDSFSGWPILAPVPSLDAETTARVFFKEVVSRFGIPRQISSDRGSAFMSTFFTTLMKLLNIKHRISAAKAPRSNGLAEALVKRLSNSTLHYKFTVLYFWLLSFVWDPSTSFQSHFCCSYCFVYSFLFGICLCRLLCSVFFCSSEWYNRLCENWAGVR